MRFRLVSATVLVCLSSTVALADLTLGRDKLVAGDYKTAIAELGKVSGSDRPAGQILLARAKAATGDLAGAITTVTPFATGAKDAQAIEARILLSELLVKSGKQADARKNLEDLYKSKPDDRTVRTALGKLRRAQGENLAAKELFDKTIKEYDARKLDLDDPVQLIQIATAARYTQQFELANDTYGAALKIAPQMTDAAVDWSDLFLQKYSAPLAEQTLEEVFKLNPNHPDAHAAMADTILETSYDMQAVRHHLDAAFSVNPKNVRALKARASVEIDRNQWDAANKTLDEVASVDATDLEAIALRATIWWLRDDAPKYNAERSRAFAINANYAELYRIVARSAVREHRYVEAIELEKEAVKLRPDFYEAMAGAGMGYLRLGMEKEGVEWIDKSWAGDKYNVRAYNTRTLFKQTIPKEYSVQSTKSFKIRYHNEEKAAFSRYLEPTMEKAFADMSKRYGFTPKTPVILELYGDRDDYGIRTVGLPDLSALGVCFGQVITAMSPATGDINWGMVMWHELGHVFAIQLSNSRVPRWFTEGLSEYETLVANPTWRRENDSDLYNAVANGTLPSIGALNSEFMQPDQSAVIVAYFQSAVTIEWLVNSYGFPKIVDALKLFGKGKESAEVLQTITGKTIAQLDTDFRKYLDIRLAAYKGTFSLPKRGFDDITKLEIAADAAPKDANARANIALGHFYAGDAEHAAAAVTTALALDPKQPIARYIQAEILMHEEETAKAKSLYVGLAADGHDSYDIRVRLAQIAQIDGDAADFEKQLCAAKKLDPEKSYPYEELNKLFKKQRNQAKANLELEHYVFIEQMELAPLKELMSEFAKSSNWAKVRTYGEMATFLAPGDPEVLVGLGRAYVELGDGNKALYTFDTAMVVNPAPRRPALVHIGRTRAYMAMGKMKEAKAALALALKFEGENAEANELKKKLP